MVDQDAATAIFVEEVIVSQLFLLEEVNSLVGKVCASCKCLKRTSLSQGGLPALDSIISITSQRHPQELAIALGGKILGQASAVNNLNDSLGGECWVTRLLASNAVQERDGVVDGAADISLVQAALWLDCRMQEPGPEDAQINQDHADLRGTDLESQGLAQALNGGLGGAVSRARGKMSVGNKTADVDNSSSATFRKGAEVWQSSLDCPHGAKGVGVYLGNELILTERSGIDDQ
jgi:hypothetical protein